MRLINCHTSLQIVFIPSWILLSVFAIGVGVFACMLLVLYKIEENQQELEQRKLANVLLIVCASVIAVCLIVFLVSPSYHLSVICALSSKRVLQQMVVRFVLSDFVV